MVHRAVGLPIVGEFGDPQVLLDLATAAERAGWDGVYLWDHVLYHEPSWPVTSPVVAAAAIAAATSRVSILTANALPRRPPWLVARDAAALDVLSGGRQVFVAILGSMDTEFTAFGEPADLRERATRLDGSLEFLASAWRGAPASWRGGTPVRFLPARPDIPIWCGGRWPRRAGFRRAARWQGVVATFTGYGRGPNVPPPLLAEAVAFLRDQRGGTLDGFDVAMEGQTAPGERLDAYVEAGLTWWIEEMGWWRGGVAAAQDRIAAGPPAS